MPKFHPLPEGATDLKEEGLSILLNNFRAQPPRMLTAEECMLLRQATIDDVCLILVEEEPEDSDTIQYHAEMSVSVERCLDAMTGQTLEQGNDAPCMWIDRNMELCANFDLSHRLLMQLPALYRAAVTGILVRKSLRSVKRLAMEGVKQGQLENPSGYFRLRKEALIRFYQLLNDRKGGCT